MGGEAETLRIRLLGGFSVSVGNRTIQENMWRLRKAAGLVKLLALSPDHRLHREQLLELLWPDLAPKAAANNLHYALHGARRTLGINQTSASPYLRFQGERLGLCPEGLLWVDVEAFEDAAGSRVTREPAAYRRAIELYAGELLPGDRYEDWADARRQELRDTFLSLLVELARLYEGRGEHESAIKALQRLLVEEPAREVAHVGLMRLYVLSGRQGDALGQYERLREVLAMELGAEPTADTLRLREEIARGRFAPERLADGEPRLRGHRPPVGTTCQRSGPASWGASVN